MERREIELFLKAKRDERRIGLIARTCLGILVLSPVLLSFSVTHGLFWTVFPVAMAAAFVLGFDRLLPRIGAVSRAELLDVIESQINRDPEALIYLKSLE